MLEMDVRAHQIAKSKISLRVPNCFQFDYSLIITLLDFLFLYFLWEIAYATSGEAPGICSADSVL